MREKLNAVLDAEKVAWAVYGTYSGFHLFVNPSGLKIGPYNFDPTKAPLEDLKNQPKALVNKLRLAMLVNGVDLNPRGGGLAVLHPHRSRCRRTRRRRSVRRSAC